MIDVHCLVHKTSPYFPKLIDSMKGQFANFHVVDNGSNIGEGRINGFAIGDSPYVASVDYDDFVMPGIFRKIEETLERGADWVYTDEVIVDAEGNAIIPGWSSNPKLYVDDILNLHRVSDNDFCHHILAFRRELLTKEMKYIMRQLVELSEVYLKDELRRSSNYVHIKEVGYFWRLYGGNGIDGSYIATEIFRRNNGSIIKANGS